MQGIPETLKKLTSMECQARAVQSKRASNIKEDANKAKYTQQLSDDVDKHVKALTKLSSTFKSVASDDYDEKGLPKLMETWRSAQSSHAELMDWAGKFDLKVASRKRQKT